MFWDFFRRKNYIEMLPEMVRGENGHDYHLRIKREKIKYRNQWCIRYLGRINMTKSYKKTKAEKIKGYTYEVYIEFCGNNLERVARHLYQRLKRDNKL